ncbi:PGA_2 [Blepharisma stoltei]|uniref:Peptidase A1 domain-containing protein n=1 Tax=Blepharisma stoltei TaxID=1481888 RepID=A0AAU9J9Q3_9CILI|nr:unnamed protein product [Blepharisma stoltei]
MIILFIFLSLAEALISVPLYKELKPLTNILNKPHPFSLRRLSSSSAVTNYENYQYYTQIGVGTPPQNFTAAVSLKYSWIFIDNKNCSQCRDSTIKFDSNSSSTFQSGNKYLTLGKLEGYTGKDTVKLGDVVAESQGILLLNKESGIDTLKSDGILGLGFTTSNDENPSILSILYAQNDISHKIFSIYLNDCNSPSDLPDYGPSVLMIDGHDINKYSAESNFTYIKAANSNGSWQMDFDSASFDGVIYTSGSAAIITPGTSFILGPTDIINDILKRLHNNYNCFGFNDKDLSCNCNSNYPDFILQISGVKFTVKPTAYLMKSGLFCVPTFDYSAIPNISNAWVLGDPFLRRFYSLYDMDNMKIGFATVGHTSQISYNNSSSSNSSGSGSSGTNSTSGSNSTNSGSGSGTSGNGSGTTNPPTGSGSNGSGTHNSTGSGSNNSGTPNSTDSGGTNSNNSSSSDSSDDNWKLILAIALPVSAVFIALVAFLAILFIKIRKSRKSVQKTLEEEDFRTREEAQAQVASNNFPDKDYQSKETAAYSAFGPFKQCGICASMLPAKALIGFPCDHYFCKVDLKHFLEKNINENSMEPAIRCPINNCPGEINSIAVQSLWDEFQKNHAISINLSSISLELKNNEIADAEKNGNAL